MEYLKTVALAGKCTEETEVSMVGPECYRLVAFCANSLGASLCSFHPRWVFKSSGEQQ